MAAESGTPRSMSPRGKVLIIINVDLPECRQRVAGHHDHWTLGLQTRSRDDDDDLHRLFLLLYVHDLLIGCYRKWLLEAMSCLGTKRTSGLRSGSSRLPPGRRGTIRK